eukprot:gene3828-4419_t
MDQKNNIKGKTLFFRVKDRVKKGVFYGSSIADLKDLFIQKYPEFPKDVECPFYMMDKSTGQEIMIENTNDIDEFQVLLVRHDSVEDVKKRSPGYTGLDKEKIVLVMVGLPARGKTYVARKICRMLNWMLVPAKVFNVGEYRRIRIGTGQTHDFFDPQNPEGIRQLVLTRCTREKMNVLFVESICTDPDVIEANIKETKLLSPDYAGTDSSKAVQDFRERINHYTKVYEPVEGSDLQYIKLIDVGKKIEVNNITALDEIDAGICDGMTYEEIMEKMPDERAARDSDKLQYRYPRGESYEDVIQRLEPMLLELERTKLPVLIVSHQATLRCLYSYLKGRVKEECPFLNIPLHTLIQLTPKAYGCEEKIFKLC